MALSDSRDSKIFDTWMACATQEEIAEAVGVHKDTVSEIAETCRKKFSETKSDKSLMEHSVDFDPPIYNIWKQQEKTAGAGTAGAPVQRKATPAGPQNC